MQAEKFSNNKQTLYGGSKTVERDGTTAISQVDAPFAPGGNQWNLNANQDHDAPPLYQPNLP